MNDLYDKYGRPLEPTQWEQLCEDLEYRQVALDEFGLYTVSTVWMGLDMNIHRLISGRGRPLIFETAVINRGKIHTSEWFPGLAFHDLEVCERYATLDEARDGHEAICARVRSAVLC